MSDDPSVHELVRQMSMKIDNLSDQVRAQRNADRELIDLKIAALDKDITEDRGEIAALKARLDRMGNVVWTAVIGPVIVGLVLWLLTRG